MVQASHPGRVGSFSSVQVGHSQPSLGFTRCVFPAAGVAVLSGLVDFVPTFKTKGFSLSGMMASTAAPASSLSSDFVSPPPPTPALSVSACSGLSSASSYSYSHSDSSPSSSSEFSC